MSVYFAERDRLIKIGWSRDVLARTVALKAKLIGAIPGDRTVETATHKRFSHLRVHGEWFTAGEDLLTCIRNEAQDHKPDSTGTQQVAIRLPDSLLKRIDEIAEYMSPEGVHVTRAEVLRRATFLGIEELEAEDKKRTR